MANEKEMKVTGKQAAVEQASAKEEKVAAKPAAEKAAAKSTAKPAAEKAAAKSAAKPAAEKTAVKPAAKPVEKASTKTTEKTPVKPAAEKKTTKEPVKKTAEKKPAAKKTASSVKTEVNIFIQSHGKEIEHQEIIENVKADWAAKGNDITKIKTLSTYIKPEEGMVYYVINDIPDSGKIDF